MKTTPAVAERGVARYLLGKGDAIRMANTKNALASRARARDEGIPFRRRLAHAGVRALVLVPYPVRAEGARQLGLFKGNEGDTYATARVDILSPGEVINVHLCGIADTDWVSVETLDPSGFTVYGPSRGPPRIPYGTRPLPVVTA